MTPEAKKQLENEAQAYFNREKNCDDDEVAFLKGSTVGYAIGAKEERERIAFYINKYIQAYHEDFFHVEKPFKVRLEANSAALCRIVLAKVLAKIGNPSEEGASE